MSKKSLLSIVILILISLGFSFAIIYFNQTPKSETINKPKIITTFFPLYDLTKQIVGDKFEVTNLVGNSEPHDYEITGEDLKVINSSKILILHGKNLDTWLEKSLPEIQDNGVKIVKTSDNLDLKYLEDNQSEYDPHFWLDPILMQDVVKNINQNVIELDQSDRDFYKKNTDRLLNKLNDLDQKYKNSLAVCSNKKVLTMHEAFNYLGSRYNLEFTSISGINTESELSVLDYKIIADSVSMQETKFLLIQPELMDTVGEKIASELGVTVLPLSTLETPSIINNNSNADYFSLMESNLSNLKKALECE